MSAGKSAPERKTTLGLTPGSKVKVRSAGPKDDALVSTGTFRGLVSIAGDSSLAIELEEGTKEEKGQIRLVPLNALLAIDILHAAKPEEEKRPETTASPGYFR